MPPPILNVKPTVLSLPMLLCFDLLVALFKSIAPLSALVIAFRIWAFATGRRKSLLLSRTSIFRRVINIWLLAESLFYLHLKRRSFQAQAQPHETKIVKLSPEERSTLFERCLETVNSPQEFAESWYRSHHTFRDLKRENIREWLGWGLFHKHNVDKDMDEQEKKELENLVSQFELACSKFEEEPNWKLPEGKNSDAMLMKFSEEPVTHSHRPLVMYTIVHFALQEFATPFFLSRLGFCRGSFNTVSYHYRPGVATGQEREPVVFIHGLGIGVIPYAGFLKLIVAKTEDANSSLYGRAILCIELHAVSQRLHPTELHRDEFVEDVKGLMKQLAFFNGGIIMGHSYGSFAVSWLAQRAPEIVRGIGLLDPAALFLHYPNVLYSILYKSPLNGYERFMHYLIREELFFNAHARRHFFWYANILYLEDVDTVNTPTLVVLSEDDFIVPIRQALKYCQKYNTGYRLPGKGYSEKSNEGKVDLLYLDNCDHGGFLWMQHHLKSVLDGVERMADKLQEQQQ